MSIIIGLYDELETAENVVRDLENNGLNRQDLHLATYDSRAKRQESGGFFQALSNLFGSQPQDVGSGTQGMVQQLTGWGVPEQDAQHYSEAMRRGSTMVLVNTPDNQAQQAKQIMDGYGPIDLEERASQWQQSGWQGYNANARPYTEDEIAQERNRYSTSNLDQGGERRIPIVEEELRAGKRDVSRGGVRIHQTVTERPVEETLNLRDETVNVERRPADRTLTDADVQNAFQEQTFEVNEVDEEIVTDKQARVTGEVLVSKQVEEHPETVRDTVRRTEVQTEDLGAGQRRTSGGYSSFENDFRNNYDMLYGSRGQDYSYYEPAYRYGYDLNSNQRYSGQKWSQIEPEVRNNWERTHLQSKWDDFKDAVRFAWERGTRSGAGQENTGTQNFGTGTGTQDYGTGTGTNR